MQIDRDDIHLISRHSNWSQKGVKNALLDNVYSDAASWKKFLRYVFMSLAVCFITAGIIFFFAYNWADLHRFVKLGMMEAIVLTTVILPSFLQMKDVFKKIILTVSALLVGVLFALFGQIYQTGAIEFDFFLAWTIFISLWAILSNFFPLWLLYLGLLNITVALYGEQVAYNWPEVFICLLLFMLDSSILIAGYFLSRRDEKFKQPSWFSNIILLAAACIATTGIMNSLFEDHLRFLFPISAITTVLYAIGIRYGLMARKISYLAIIPFSTIVIFSAVFIKLSDNGWMFLVNSLFVVASVGLLIKFLIDIQKKWKNE